jgi:hypothetical protein
MPENRVKFGALGSGQIANSNPLRGLRLMLVMPLLWYWVQSDHCTHLI